MTSSNANNDIHISSVIVQTLPDALARISNRISSFTDTEIHLSDPLGKLVLTIETQTMGQTSERIDEITKLDGVLNAVMVYHQTEDANTLDQIVELDENKTATL